jgi:hypothetical protein
LTIPNARPSDPHQQTIDDLAEEAQHWLDGSEIKSEAEAEAVTKLLDMARAAHKAADEERKIEAKPFDDGKAEVQRRYNPMLAKATLISDTCKKVLEPWRKAVQAKKEAEARRAQELAEAQARMAREAVERAGNNIVEREAAIAKVEEAEKQAKFANRLTKQASQNTGLRRSYEPWITGFNAALRHYFSVKPERFEALVTELAKEDIARGVRDGIPGIEIIEKKGAI